MNNKYNVRSRFLKYITSAYGSEMHLFEVLRGRVCLPVTIPYQVKLGQLLGSKAGLDICWYAMEGSVCRAGYGFHMAGAIKDVKLGQPFTICNPGEFCYLEIDLIDSICKF